MFKKIAGLVALICLMTGIACAEGRKNPVVTMDTSLGAIKIELFEKEAPISVKNFLDYATSGFYAGTTFHRIVPASPQSQIVVIQGGGLTQDLKPKQTRAPIKNEAGNGLKNDRGTLSMARSQAPDSATSQFFINVKNNNFLNRPSPDGVGYAVFGKVIEGMDVVDRIVAVKTHTVSIFQGVPDKPVIIKSVTTAR